MDIGILGRVDLVVIHEAIGFAESVRRIGTDDFLAGLVKWHNKTLPKLS